MRTANYFDNENAFIDMSREELKRGFARKDICQSKSTLSENLKSHILLLFNKGIKQQKEQIEKSKKCLNMKLRRYFELKYKK